MIRFEDTPLKGVKLVTPQIYEDFRGENMELYNTRIYQENGIPLNFIQDNISVSSQHVLRGMHGDTETWKLVSCLYGRIYLVVLNYDESSPEYGKWTSFSLSDQSRQQVLIPPKFANGHLVLSEKAIFHYKLSAYFTGKAQFSIPFDDPRFKIWWPVKQPIRSRRDEEGNTAFTGRSN